MLTAEDIFKHGLRQVIKSLKNAGIEDITQEIVGLEKEGKRTEFKFYTEEQWLSNPQNKANEAVSLFGKSYKGFKYPDHIVEYDGVKYFVVVI
ncbi:hypothetical protein JR318_gp156 [Escherichia phage vB_vPM_PD06]|uniref:Uncharacterized protein n=3 Tax=Justusliebigvirus TaxID=2948775 RepID=A0A386KIJ3_9CAUD|nr:hypothetical protein JR317_gp082 [Escherichia phage vB_EcoM_PHB05]YP_009984755.1 hypothetical protein JR318_gp156 [Escherichia phage vB_vPM_PD06]AMM43425.1 hypothetical protein ECGD1_099 [Enterobacteria phage ECGD1]AXY81448.1 hypothetical protein [Escherichia phage vB_vPM_PD114]QHR75334.1 hypothetical protein outra_13 [Escherichia phage outra]QXV78364.1 hypothetical protein bas61_0235 [Escherichia phage EmilieFrey]QXV81575.1 hypothetical protein bas62_0229 [Escherichia phage JohannJBalmer]